MSARSYSISRLAIKDDLLNTSLWRCSPGSATDVPNRVGRKPKRNPHARGPHPWAFLAAWRELAGLTQAQVAEHFGISDVSIHRWETGKAPVTVQKYLLLAKLYAATDPSALMWAPTDFSVQNFREAGAIMHKLTPEDLQRWLDIGRSLSRKNGESHGSQN